MGLISPVPSRLDPLYGAIASSMIDKQAQEPREITEWLTKVYKLCDDPRQVNWNARRQIDSRFYQETVLPSLAIFLERFTGEITDNEGDMNALIGLSGGLDSTVAAYIVGNAMQSSIISGRRRKASLTLLNLVGLEDNDTKTIASDLQKKHGAVRVIYLEADISKIRRNFVKTTAKLVRKLGEEALEFPGELTTKIICGIVNEVGARSGHASIDPTNGTEYILGEFTVGLGYDISILSDLYKSSVFELGRILQVPPFVLEAPPRNSAYGTRTKPELYFGKVPEGVTSKQVFEVLDPVIYWLHERNKTPQEISAALGHDEGFVQGVKRRIDGQRLRRVTPHFCVESHKIEFPNITPLSEEEAKRQIEKTMLVEAFR